LRVPKVGAQKDPVNEQGHRTSARLEVGDVTPPGGKFSA
jgi:hypothetical protein